jgi:N-acetylglucosamine-6-phosphate deacetylase
LKIVTLAPERTGAIPFIRSLVEAGVTPAIGHTGASPERILEAVEAGARLSTHLGNGSHAQLPRLRNYLWEQLASDALGAGIIADGYHLPHSVIKVFHRVKGRERLILVSDVGPMGGLESGVHKWGNIDVEVHPDGHLGLPGTEFLAGAGHLLDRGVAQFLRATGTSLEETLYLVTLGPASLLGLPEHRAGSQGAGEPALLPLPEVGEPADLVQFRYEAGTDALAVEAAVGGNRVWRKDRE